LIEFKDFILYRLWLTQLATAVKQIANANASQSGLAIALATLFSAISSLNYRRIKAKVAYGVSFINIAIGYALIAWAVNYPVVGLGLITTG
jgi:hypothetical protein